MSDKKTYKLLILGAFEPEVNLLLEAFDKGNQIIDFNNLALDIQVGLCGIGSLNSALYLKDSLSAKSNPDEILFLGSAGAYFKNRDNPDYVLSYRFCQNDFTVMQDMARNIVGLNDEIIFSGGKFGITLQQSFQFNANNLVNSTNSISLVELQADSVFLEQYKSDLIYENLEVYGLARVCQSIQIPFSSLLAVTNEVNPEGSSQWQKNHKKMGAMLQHKLLDLLT